MVIYKNFDLVISIVLILLLTAYFDISWLRLVVEILHLLTKLPHNIAV